MISEKNILNLQKKREIYQFISENPGIHFREISRQLNIPITTLGYHIKFLKKYNYISSKLNSGYRRYWVLDKVSKMDKELLALLRQETPRRIIITIYLYTACSQIDLSEVLEKHPATIDYHLKKLIDLGIIEQAPYKNGNIQMLREGYELRRPPRGTEIFYRIISEDVLRCIYDLIITYNKKLPEDPSVDLFIKRATTPKAEFRQKVLLSPKDYSKALEKRFFEIFPHPYYCC